MPADTTRETDGTMFSMKRIATLAMITAATIVPAVGAQAAKVDAPERHASIASINVPKTKHAGPVTLPTSDDVGVNAEPLGWQWSDMSG
jgi:hypothetical protein